MGLEELLHPSNFEIRIKDTSARKLIERDSGYFKLEEERYKLNEIRDRIEDALWKMYYLSPFLDETAKKAGLEVKTRKPPVIEVRDFGLFRDLFGWLGVYLPEEHKVILDLYSLMNWVTPLPSHIKSLFKDEALRSGIGTNWTIYSNPIYARDWSFEFDPYSCWVFPHEIFGHGYCGIGGSLKEEIKNDRIINEALYRASKVKGDAEKIAKYQEERGYLRYIA